MDTKFIFSWWLMFFTFGVAGLPLAHLIFKRFTDVGYSLAKTFSTLIVAYGVFFFSIFHILPFTRGVLFVFSGLYIAGNLYIFIRHKDEIIKNITKRIKIVISQEILFTLGFIFWSLIRGYQPDINGLEKFMDYGFINSILRTKYLPPADMWFAGKSINYYWFGHYWTAFLTKLSGIPSSATYNLMLATILGLGLASAFAISSTLISTIRKGINKKAIYVAGLLSALLLIFGGNFHTPYYVLKDGKDVYWYPDATRFIGYNPDVEDKTIHEFPMYSFTVSDLHAHLINFPFVLLYIAVLWSIIDENKRKTFKLTKMIIPGALLGVMFMTSTWDFGNYTLLAGITLLLFNFLSKGLSLDTLIDTAKQGAVLVITGLVVALPFILNFESIAQGVKLVHSHSPLWQLSILWGFPAILTVTFVITTYLTKIKLKKSDVFVFAMLTASWILIVLPEIIYVKDIYIASHYRANTMFKLTYQAFVMFYLSSGYIVVRSLNLIHKKSMRYLGALFFSIILASILYYPYFAIKSYYGELRVYHGLSGETWLQQRYPGEYAALAWLRKNVKDQPYILEAPGDSYTDYNVISSYSGLPTVSGWFVHEWLWRGDASFPQARVTDIDNIYNTTDEALAKQLLNKYAVKYVLVGTLERQKYPTLDQQKFLKIGKAVFTSGFTTIYEVN